MQRPTALMFCFWLFGYTTNNWDSWQAVDISYNWSENNTKVVIVPENDLKTNTLYALDLLLEDTNKSQTYDNSIEFYTTE